MRKPSLSSTAVVTGRALLLALAAAAATVAFVVARAPSPRRNPAATPLAAYGCPMHPDVIAESPGDCPICGMALEPRKPGAVAGNATAVGSGDPAPATVVLPATAAIATFDELGFGKLHPMAREMRGPGWAESPEVIQALFYRDEIALLAADEDALFFPSTHAKDGIQPSIRATRVDEPPTPWDDATALIRLRVASRNHLTTGQTGSIKFTTRVRESLAVRAPAVIHSPAGPYVLLVADDKRTLTKRPIKIGSVLYEHATVLDGLAVGERVAVLNTFLLDAERRLRGGGTP